MEVKETQTPTKEERVFYSIVERVHEEMLDHKECLETTGNTIKYIEEKKAYEILERLYNQLVSSTDYYLGK